MTRASADLLSFVTLPHPGLYPASWFPDGLNISRFTKLQDSDEDTLVSTFPLAQSFALTLIRGPLNEDGIEVDSHKDMLGWCLGDVSPDGNGVLGTTQDIRTAQDADRSVVLDVGEQKGEVV